MPARVARSGAAQRESHKIGTDLLSPGTIFAGYRIEDHLSTGSMGVVYRATQLSLGRVVALKILSPDLASDANFRLRFRREGRLQARLEHPHIVPVYEAGQADHGLFLAMRLIAGPNLKDLIGAGEIDPTRSIKLLRQVADALDTAHASGLIHRDVKPQNILIGRGDHAFLADFGLTRASDEEPLTVTGQFLGTIDYVSPEQIRGDPATASSDIYALTGVLVECLTRTVPFPRDTDAGTVFAHLTGAPPSVSDRCQDLPPSLDAVIAQGLAKDPDARPGSATELISTAARAIADFPVSGP
ncbi:MAG: hypothetical protein NVS4B3_27250 [Gemmatimonadaceae bacterium]